MSNINTTEKIIEELNLTQDSQCAFYGEHETAPLHLNILGIEPLSLSFKIKINTRQKPNIKLSESLKELKKSKNADVDFYSGYAWLSFYNLTGFCSHKLIDIITNFINSLRDLNYLEDYNSCNSCKKEKESNQIICSGSDVVRICEDCLVEKVVDQERREEDANQTNQKYIFAVIPILVVSAISWAVFWLGYDKIFEVLKTRRVMIPSIVVVAIFTVIAVSLSFPLGKTLRKSGLMIKYSPVSVTIVTLAFTAIIGENLYFTFSIEGSSFGRVFLNLANLLKLYSWQFLIFKFFLLVLIGAGVLDFSVRVKKKMKL